VRYGGDRNGPLWGAKVDGSPRPGRFEWRKSVLRTHSFRAKNWKSCLTPGIRVPKIRTTQKLKRARVSLDGPVFSASAISTSFSPNCRTLFVFLVWKTKSNRVSDAFTWCHTISNVVSWSNTMFYAFTRYDTPSHVIRMCYTLYHGVLRLQTMLRCLTRCYTLLLSVLRFQTM